MRKGEKPKFTRSIQERPQLGKSGKSSMIHSEVKVFLCTPHPKHASNVL
jgi:hypothetical protein